jgi:hypothetical protein
MRLLGKGPMGENGACAAFDTPGLPIEFQTLVTPLADGKVKEVTRMTNKGNITGIAGLLEDLQGAAAAKEGAVEGAAVKAEGAAAAKEGAVEGAAVKAEGTAVEGEGAAAESEKATEGDKGKAGAGAEPEKSTTDEVAKEEGEAVNPNTATISKDDIKEIDAIDSQGNRYKSYLVRKFSFPGLENMNLVHFMGWGTATDEFIPDSEADKKILPRDETSKTGQSTGQDTIDQIMKIYEKVDMANMESKAKEAAEEYKKEHKEVVAAREAMASIDAAASASAAAAAAAAASVAAGQRK